MKPTERLLLDLRNQRDNLQSQVDDLNAAISVLEKLHGNNKSKKTILRAGKAINPDVQGEILTALKSGHPQITPHMVWTLGISASPSAAGLALNALRGKKLVRKLSRGLYTLR